MNKARITFKGQVTIPKVVREALTIQEGDTVIFEVEGDHAILKPLKKKFLTDFYGALPANQPYPGLDAIRKKVHRKMGKRFHRKEAV